MNRYYLYIIEHTMQRLEKRKELGKEGVSRRTNIWNESYESQFDDVGRTYPAQVGSGVVLFLAASNNKFKPSVFVQLAFISGT